MVRPGERWLFVIVFLSLVLFTTYQEHEFLRMGLTSVSLIWPAFSVIVLTVPGKVFLTIVSKLFLDLGLTTTRLHEFSSERSRIASEGAGPNTDEFRDMAALVTNTLKFAESWLHGWIKGSHFELCVFVDREMPLLFAYFDSNKDTISRSSQNRNASPTYYRDEDYEVIKLLDAPSSVPHIVPNTTKSTYVFTSRNQESQIGSTILLYADVSVPCVLVLTSDKKKAFDKKNKEVILFVKYIAETVYYDLRQRDFVNRIRKLKPELFAIPQKPT
jgi:hypothetical protein